MINGKSIDDVTLVISWRVVGAWSAEKARLSLDPLVGAAVGCAVDRDAVSELNLEHLDAGLRNSQVGHFDVQAMEVDAIETLVHGLGKFSFTDLLDSLLVVEGAELVELSEQVVEFGEGARVLSIGRPVAA